MVAGAVAAAVVGFRVMDARALASTRVRGGLLVGGKKSEKGKRINAAADFNRLHIARSPRSALPAVVAVAARLWILYDRIHFPQTLPH